MGCSFVFLGKGQFRLVLNNLLFGDVHKVTALKPGYKMTSEGAYRYWDLTDLFNKYLQRTWYLPSTEPHGEKKTKTHLKFAILSLQTRKEVIIT